MIEARQRGPAPARRGRAAARLLPCLAALLGACAPAGKPALPRLVILYATCTLATGHLSPYAPSVAYTPNLDTFAREAVVFERHVTEAAQSGTAYASIFSGTHADRHGVYHHPSPLSPAVPLVAEAFAASGFEPFYWHGHRMADPALGYARGVPDANRIPWQVRTKLSLTDEDPDFVRVLERLADDPEYRAFIQVSFFLTHGPYLGPEAAEAFRERHPALFPGLAPGAIARSYRIYLENTRRLQWNFPETAAALGLDGARLRELAATLELAYAASVENLDRYFGLTLAALRSRGLLDQTLIAFTADHGEVLFRDNALFRWTHGMQLAPEDLGVPWILRAPPGMLEPGRYAGVTRSVDVFPTLVGLAGAVLPPGAALEGVDLSAALRGEAPPPALVALSHTTTLIPGLAEESKSWTLFHSLYPRTDPELIWVGAREGDVSARRRRTPDGQWVTEVFDLEADPEERQNRYAAADPRHRELEGALAAYKERLVRGFPARATLPAPPGETLERLRSLGYAE